MIRLLERRRKIRKVKRKRRRKKKKRIRIKIRKFRRWLLSITRTIPTWPIYVRICFYLVKKEIEEFQENINQEVDSNDEDEGDKKGKKKR